MAKKKTSAGKGKKLCPNCGEYVGARTQECACGHKFRKKRMSQATTTQQSAPQEMPLSADQIGTVLAAQKLIQECGGTEAALSLLKTVGKSAS